jgi:hypothetical protein
MKAQLKRRMLPSTPFLPCRPRRDPVTEFVRLLFVEYDFDGAQAQLALCEEVCHL